MEILPGAKKTVLVVLLTVVLILTGASPAFAEPEIADESKAAYVLDSGYLKTFDLRDEGVSRRLNIKTLGVLVGCLRLLLRWKARC